jgi:hypothetical protein
MLEPGGFENQCKYRDRIPSIELVGDKALTYRRDGSPTSPEYRDPGASLKPGSYTIRLKCSFTQQQAALNRETVWMGEAISNPIHLEIVKGAFRAHVGPAALPP